MTQYIMSRNNVGILGILAYPKTFIADLQSTKILLVHLICKIIILLLNCDSDIELFYIAPCKIIAIDLLYFYFLCQIFSLLLLLKLSLFQLSQQQQLKLSSILEVIAKKNLYFSLLPLRATTIAVAIVGRAINLKEAIQKRKL